MNKSFRFLLPTLACIIASVASLLLPILTYVYPNGKKVAFNVFAFAASSQELVDILADYSGPYAREVDRVWLTILAILAVLAILAAFFGVITMSLQRPNTWQFLLALIGIFGTAIPALIVIIAAPISQRFLPGTFRFGIYPIITPIAMLLCLLKVTKRHRDVQAEKRVAEKANGLIRPGGDLL
jgi:hypothetical protein